jgi:hypothetical protein
MEAPRKSTTRVIFSSPALSISERPMRSMSIEFVADLGPASALRVVSSTTRHLVVETKARKQERIATIDLTSGDVSLSKTDSPLVNLISGSWSGQRWSTAHSAKSRACQPHTTVAWQDTIGGKIYAVELSGEQCVCTSCPQGCNSMFVGTRKNAKAGRLHFKSRSDQDFKEVVVAPGGGEAFVLHA